jgi:hypothetical protein
MGGELSDGGTAGEPMGCGVGAGSDEGGVVLDGACPGGTAGGCPGAAPLDCVVGEFPAGAGADCAPLGTPLPARKININIAQDAVLEDISSLRNLPS